MSPKFKLKDWSSVALSIAIIVAIVDHRGRGCSYLLKGLLEELNGARKIHEKLEAVEAPQHWFKEIEKVEHVLKIIHLQSSNLFL